MFCPKCSRQQIYDEIRFCSRCGFKLNVVKALLADNDASASKASASTISAPAAPDPARRKKDMMSGAALMVVFALHTAWTTEDLSLDREYTSLIVKCLILCGLINIMPAIRNFFAGGAAQEDSRSFPKMLSRLAAKFKRTDQNAALPAAYDSRPAAGYFTGRIKTGEFTAPPSVTEDTTNLLRNN
jgi:hypothetical protein